MSTKSLRSRKALEEVTKVSIESDIPVTSEGGQQKESGQNRKRNLSGKILDMLEKLEWEVNKRSGDIIFLKDQT
jgi:hypothetical protein